MSAIRCMVDEVRIDTVDVSTLGGHRDVTRGRTFVGFRTVEGDTFDLEWTYRGDPPAVGSRWTLIEEGEAP